MTDQNEINSSRRPASSLKFTGWFLPCALSVSLAIFGACNLEVGNPDTGEAPMPGLNSIVLRMQQYNSCGGNALCNSVPVQTPDASASLSYEITGAEFALATVTPVPLAVQPVSAQLNLIRETTVSLTGQLPESQVSGLVLAFSSPRKGTQSWQLSGTLTGNFAGTAVRIPLPLSGSGDIAGSVEMPGEGLEAVVLDPAVWFDLANEPSVVHIVRALQGGTCIDSRTRRCDQLVSVLSGLVEKRIEKSFRAQARRSAAQKSQKIP